ncbi:DEAD/DEAH box helicase family protein [Saccharopolyspora sp. HNM0986]|uniref:DEAD/DEAH box helicase family protein n=1 Tax=Saccharopolyspora galaxeae TaxID=2781241 RepID=UPI00190DD751|nr:DEAD/DEAH box helicase family protein [Saccharopolyspora sp. HNM0986]MBK0869638.1 DEAD/DEAH box helicase family protein [Saccharopolyspora sp. HNM0986]
MDEHGDKPPQRRVSLRERRLLYERADGRCQRCGADLGPDWHAAHLVATCNGGPTELENMQAWCARCNLRLGGRDAEPFDGLRLREWQAQALPVILERIFYEGSATLQAAGAAGKTVFAASVFKSLREAGYAERMVVIVPNTALVEQWRRALAELRIDLDSNPAGGIIETRSRPGIIVTYQSVQNSAGAHSVRLRRKRTLVVLDEVHHVATDASWGSAVQTMIGNVVDKDIHAAAVLNMTGTLFRSSPKRRISTVRYERVLVDGRPKLQAVADCSVSSRDLIDKKLLRPVDLFAYTGWARFVDVNHQRETRAQIADLDDPQSNMVLLQACTSDEWLRGFVAEAVRLLENQLAAIEYAEPLKLLFVAPTQQVARRAALALNRVTGRNFARLVTSDEPEALRTLRSAAAEPNSCGIVAVRMVTEGFDCAHVSTIAYAANVTAPLFISQVTARAMRITGTERARATVLPAAILVPDHPALQEAFRQALADAAPAADEDDGELPTGPEPAAGMPRTPRFEFLGLGPPWLNSVTPLEEDQYKVDAEELAAVSGLCERVHLPVAYAPRVAVGYRHYPPRAA